MSKRKSKKELGELIRFSYRDVPNKLKPNPFFLKVLSMEAHDLFQYNLDALSSYGFDEVHFFCHPTDGYIFARGSLPVCLCAHMDKVPWYKTVERISKKSLLNDNGSIVDVILSSKQGIGGDDRCGVYAILSMLKLGFRPSVLFCMGEEVGCRGSHRFVQDFPKEFLSDVNAFIQIDRRGNEDCVCYSDDNPALTEAVCQFGFKPAFGSCTDISVLMPHFGVSGVNLSSGYYHEHHASMEYVSVKDVNRLLKRLYKILSSNIFSERYEYRARTYTDYRSFYINRYHTSLDGKVSVDKVPVDMAPPQSHTASSVHVHESNQLSLLDDYPYVEDLDWCDWCGEMYYPGDLLEVSDDFMAQVCPDCAADLVKQGEYLQCPCCKKLFRPQTNKQDPGFLADTCPFCGCVIDNNND